MTLSEKIQACRKRAGLSQEQLAERLGVSRQAVSKWETGEATPELSKLAALCSVLNVSADWFLNDIGPEPPQEDGAAKEHSSGSPDRLERLPGFISRMVRKYGWLFGVYQAVMGTVLSLIGLILIFFSRRILSGFFRPPAGMEHNQILSSFNPTAAFGGGLLVVGIPLLVSGILITLFLKRKQYGKP